jgi:hypothetical protein
VPPFAVQVVGTQAYGHGWLIRELEVVRGKMYFEIECCPAFNYARDPHEVTIVSHGARFKSEKLNMYARMLVRRVDIDIAFNFRGYV